MNSVLLIFVFLLLVGNGLFFWLYFFARPNVLFTSDHVAYKNILKITFSTYTDQQLDALFTKDLWIGRSLCAASGAGAAITLFLLFKSFTS